MTHPILAVAAALALALPTAALADKGGNGHGNGNGRGNGHEVAEGRGCPPGLARRDPACVPPGLARQGVDTEDRIGDRWRIGDVLDDDDFETVTDRRRLGLPALPDGQRYAVIDDTVVVLDDESYAILDLVRRAAAAGN